MSFKGDVGGIGLADLLQSLARGREGILTLHGKAGKRSTLGIQEGLIHLLPDPEEDPEMWRTRVRTSCIDDPETRIDSLRMVEIARAQRIEDVYALLDSEGVHFRFAPGPLPEAPVAPALGQSETGLDRKGARRDAIYVQPLSAEALLLEYARLKDEGASAGDWQQVSSDLVFVNLDSSAGDNERLRQGLDGRSNLIEIGDRLGWPLRQVQIAALAAHARGSLRLAEPHELFALLQSELAAGNTARAASRLTAWVLLSMPGPLLPEEGELLAGEWSAGRLAPVLLSMRPYMARLFLRRFERGTASPLAAIERWAEYARSQPLDELGHMHLIVAQIRGSGDANLPTTTELLRLARKLCEAHKPLRAAAFLHVAAARQPASTGERFELGLAMLAANMVAEAGPWIVEASRTLIAEGQAERALPTLRTLVRCDGDNREARRLLTRARTQTVRRTLIKKNSLVTLAVVLALSVGAVVQYRTQRSQEERFTEIKSHQEDPRTALALLEQYFPDDESAAVAGLRANLSDRKNAQDNALRTAWTDRYREAQLECTIGDLLLGLQRSLDLPLPPAGLESKDPWPLVSDLFNGLVARLENSLKELGDTVLETPAQQNGEQRLTRSIDDLLQALEGKLASDATKEFAGHLTDMRKRLHDRGESRAAARAAAARKENLARQDVLLAAARAHAKAGDHERALASYQKLCVSDDSAKLRELLAKEMGVVQAKHDAITHARELCLAGKHVQARELLRSTLENPTDYLLPWKVETFPAGAHARLKDGSVRVTPFTCESALGEHIEMQIELEGYEPAHIALDDPSDCNLLFSHAPERAWHPAGRIEALPVSVGDEHVVCDRAGNIARLGRHAANAWEKHLNSLGGVARSPVFLPHKPGTLLLVSEDGECWLVDASNGNTEGPWSRNAPPTAGPLSLEDGVCVRFRDGSLFQWDNRLVPEELVGGRLAARAAQVEEHANEAQGGASSGMAVLRRTAGGAELDSPWTDWKLEVGEQRYTLRSKSTGQALYCIDRSGDWSYVAFEAPHALIAHGRVWISDGRGLRSFLP